MSRKLATIGREPFGNISPRMRHDREPNEFSNRGEASARCRPTSGTHGVICGG